MIPDFKTFIKESLWTDIQRRSAGDTVRKEDDIELLDMVGLYEYILSHYELTDNRFEMTYGTANMSITISNNGDEILLTYKLEEVHCFFYLAKYSRLYSELSKKFYIETVDESTHYIISPKGEFTNQFFIDVLDCIIENRQTILRKKDVNESLWTDIQRRSAGDTVRKEDEIPQELQKPLAIYIDMFASNAFSGDYTVGSYPDFRAFVKDFMNSPRIMKLDFDMGDLLDYITQDHYYDIIHPVIMDTIDKINKSVDVAVDTIIDSLKDKNIKESLWTDIQHRSAGDTVRKEDDVDRFDYEEFFVYLTEHYQPKSKKINEKIGGRTSLMYTDIIEIFIPIESVDGRIKTLIVEMDKKDNSIVSMRTSATLFDKYINLERMLSKNYTLHTIKGSYGIYIKSKEKPTNRTVIDLIDIFLAVVDDPVLEKVS